MKPSNGVSMALLVPRKLRRWAEALSRSAADRKNFGMPRGLGRPWASQNFFWTIHCGLPWFLRKRNDPQGIFFLQVSPNLPSCFRSHLQKKNKEKLPEKNGRKKNTWNETKRLNEPKPKEKNRPTPQRPNAPLCKLTTKSSSCSLKRLSKSCSRAENPLQATLGFYVWNVKKRARRRKRYKYLGKRLLFS